MKRYIQSMYNTTLLDKSYSLAVRTTLLMDKVKLAITNLAVVRGRVSNEVYRVQLLYAVVYVNLYLHDTKVFVQCFCECTQLFSSVKDACKFITTHIDTCSSIKV